jgi:hypothetical protein
MPKVAVVSFLLFSFLGAVSSTAEEIEVGSYVDGAISNTAPVAFGQEVRVDFVFVGDGFPAVGAYNLILRWNSARLALRGITFGDALGVEARGDAVSAVTIIGENPFDNFWLATFSQTSLLELAELHDHQPATFLGASATFEVIDPSLTVLGGNMGFGFISPDTGIDTYMRDGNGDPISCNFCSACPLPDAPEFIGGAPLGELLVLEVGEHVQFTVSAADTDDRFLSLVASGTPAGASHSPYPPPLSNPVSTTFDWVPDRTGIFEIEYVAGDGDPTTEDPRGSVLILVTRPRSSLLRPWSALTAPLFDGGFLSL